MSYIGRFPYHYDLTVYQGEDWSISLTLSDANDNPKILTDYTAKLQIRADYDEPALLELTDADGITITPATGKVGWAFTAAQTAVFPYTKPRYDIYIASSAGTVTYLLEGYLNLRRRVTR